MTLPTISWERLRTLEPTGLKCELFAIMQSISIEIQQANRDDPEILATVPRLAQLLEERPDASVFAEVLSSLARSVGLWNYIDLNAADRRDAMIAQAVTIDGLGGITLHREQVAALNTLLSGRNLILSAPTSFGKSILIDALLLSGRYRRVAIVLPTIALLDEFRRRLVGRFGQQFDILMHHSEQPSRDHVIFLGTQERLINRDDLGKLDLAVVDEFYKLDPARRDERSITLNAAVYQLLRRSKQFFFLGPNIENVHISGDSLWRFEFLRTRFSTVALDTFDLKAVRDKDARLKQEAYNRDNWPALIFVSSPDKANKLAAELNENKAAVGAGAELAAWITANYGNKWDIGKAVASGIGVHHGRMPRALASRFVKLFNDRRLPILICTSTLIEGVNTAAKSVMIYDKTINREPYDFFTFSNIRGRAGRLGQHHVGRVFLFHTTPSPEEVDVTTPLFGDMDNAPDEFIVHLDDADASTVIADRVTLMTRRLGLTAKEVKRLSTLGIDNIEAIRDLVRSSLRKGAQLVWSGRPTYNQLRAVCEVICAARKPQDFGVASASQLTKYLDELRRASTFRAFFHWHDSTYRGDPAKIDNIFRFLRACEYSLPEYFGCVELFLQKFGRFADYALFIAELPCWFRPQPLKILEEQGVPIQISERMYQLGDTVSELTARLRLAALLQSPTLSPLERGWVLEALPA